MDIAKLLDQMDAANHRSDTLNANDGSNGTNATYDKNQGNRGKQMNPNQRKPGAPDDDEDEGDVFGPIGGSD